MAQVPSTELLEKYPKTKRILQRVYSKLADMKTKQHQPTNPAFYLTGLGPNALEAIKKGETLNLTNKPIDRYVIHKQLYNFYLSKNTLPTTKQLFCALTHTLPFDMDIASFRKLLYKMDYVWKKIENQFIVLERPEVTYERYMFLKQIFDYQEKNLPIYFVEEWVVPISPDSSYGISETTDSDKVKIVFAFSKSEIIFQNSVLPPNRTEIDYKKWITGELIPTLEKESIIVVNTDHYYTDIFNYPTINSLKVEMTDWLDRQKVPYDECMSKIELFSLIKEYTDVDSKNTTLDEVIHTYGHLSLRVPRHMYMLTPGIYLFDHLKEDPDFFDMTLGEDERRDSIHSKMNSLDIAMLDQYINVAITKYKTALCDEIVLDEKLESLMRDTGSQETGSDVDSDLPLDSDSD